MHEISVETEFAAAHAILIRGEREPIHGHNWRIEAVWAGADLDEEGLLVDFHDVEGALHEVVAPLRNSNLNDVSPFDDVNPTAELVASHIATSLQRVLNGRMRAGVRLARVRVTEAPGCAATHIVESERESGS